MELIGIVSAATYQVVYSIEINAKKSKITFAGWSGQGTLINVVAEVWFHNFKFLVEENFSEVKSLRNFYLL